MIKCLKACLKGKATFLLKIKLNLAHSKWFVFSTEFFIFIFLLIFILEPLHKFKTKIALILLWGMKLYKLCFMYLESYIQQWND